MKKINLLLIILVVLTVLVTGCSKDNKNDSKSSRKVDKTWNVYSKSSKAEMPDDIRTLIADYYKSTKEHTSIIKLLATKQDELDKYYAVLVYSNNKYAIDVIGSMPGVTELAGRRVLDLETVTTNYFSTINVSKMYGNWEIENNTEENNIDTEIKEIFEKGTEVYGDMNPRLIAYLGNKKTADDDKYAFFVQLTSNTSVEYEWEEPETLDIFVIVTISVTKENNKFIDSLYQIDYNGIAE